MIAHEGEPASEGRESSMISKDEFLRYCRLGNLAAVIRTIESGFNADFAITSVHSRTIRTLTAGELGGNKITSQTWRRTIVETPLSAAIFYGQKDVARYLVQHCQTKSCTYPHQYAYKRDENWGFDVSHPGTETNLSFQGLRVLTLTVTHSPLTLAITRGDDDTVNNLLDAGANPLFRPSPVGYENSDYVTALHMALIYKEIKANAIRKMVAIINRMRISNPAIPEIAGLLGREFSAPRNIERCSCCISVPASVKSPRSPFVIVEREICGFTEGRTKEDLHAALSYSGTDVDAFTGRDKPEVVPVPSEALAGPGVGAGATVVSPSTIGRPLLTPSSKRAVTPV